MPSQVNCSLWSDYRGAVAKGEMAMANNIATEAAIYDSLGQLYTLMGRHADAERLLRESGRVFQRLPDNVLFAVSLLHLSELHQHMRQYQCAREEAACALKLATDKKLDRLSAEARGLLLAVESDSSCHSRSKNPNVQRVGNLIKDNPHQKLSLKQMARATNVSSSRLSHVFKTETGTSPAKYMKSARMHKARSLLETTSLSVKEITFMIGLADESHFVREFKKTYGLTPARYRKRFLAENEMTSSGRTAG
jgi:AraC-like DNA-binding protein